MTPKTETKKYNRRSTDQIVADLEARIAAVKARDEAKQAKAAAKADPAASAFLVAVKALDKARRVADEHGNAALVRALEAARAPLGEQLVEMGLRLPVAKGRSGRRRKAS